MHDRYLLLLGNDDLLGKPLQTCILAVTNLDERHVNSALMVRDHHPSEVAVSIAGKGHVHIRMHAFDGLAHFRLKIRAGVPVAGTGTRGGSTSNYQREHQKSRKETAPRSTSLHHNRPFRLAAGWSLIRTQRYKTGRRLGQTTNVL